MMEFKEKKADEIKKLLDFYNNGKKNIFLVEDDFNGYQRGDYVPIKEAQEKELKGTIWKIEKLITLNIFNQSSFAKNEKHYPELLQKINFPYHDQEDKDVITDLYAKVQNVDYNQKILLLRVINNTPNNYLEKLNNIKFDNKDNKTQLEWINNDNGDSLYLIFSVNEPHLKIQYKENESYLITSYITNLTENFKQEMQRILNFFSALFGDNKNENHNENDIYDKIEKKFSKKVSEKAMKIINNLNQDKIEKLNVNQDIYINNDFCLIIKWRRSEIDKEIKVIFNQNNDEFHIEKNIHNTPYSVNTKKEFKEKIDTLNYEIDNLYQYSIDSCIPDNLLSRISGLAKNIPTILNKNTKDINNITDKIINNVKSLLFHIPNPVKENIKIDDISVHGNQGEKDDIFFRIFLISYEREKIEVDVYFNYFIVRIFEDNKLKKTSILFSKLIYNINKLYYKKIMDKKKKNNITIEKRLQQKMRILNDHGNRFKVVNVKLKEKGILDKRILFNNKYLKLKPNEFINPDDVEDINLNTVILPN